MPTGPGQHRWGRGNPTRKTGSVKSGSSGAESSADRASVHSSRGLKAAFKARRVAAHCRLCFFSVQEVTSTARANRTLEASCSRRSLAKLT